MSRRYSRRARPFDAGRSLEIERGERGISPAWNSAGMLSGLFYRALGSDNGSIRVHFRYGRELPTAERWIWSLTGSACIAHKNAGGFAPSAEDCMLAAERFAQMNLLDDPTPELENRP